MPDQSPAHLSRSQVAAVNTFALALYGQIRRRPGNLCFSPFSIRAVLVMTLPGARSETAVQIGQVLGISSGDDLVHAAQRTLIDRLNAASGGGYELAIANSVWTQDGAPLQAAFLDLITRYYGAVIHAVDFRAAPQRARDTINRWIEDRTRRKIVDLIPAGGLATDTGLVLANAVYFKGRWVLPFDMEDTRPEPFYVTTGEAVRAPLMRQREEVRYLQGEGYQAVDLDYKGGDLAMLVLLPDRREGLQDLEARLSPTMLEDCVAGLAVREIELYLPRFKITWGTVDLRPTLSALGASLPFDRDRADFSGINGYRPPHEEALFISAVFHKAFTEVNEEGTEAAAATSVIMHVFGRSSRPPPPIPVFRADHPFLYAIRDHQSGVVLFLGRVGDPTQDD